MRKEVRLMMSARVQLILIVALSVLSALVLGGDPWGP
jgi:hypothetical protein